MSTWFELVIACLMSARLTRLIIIDNGPFGILFKLRKKIGVEDATSYTAGGLVELFNCPWCMSVPVSFITVSLFIPSTVEELVAHALAVSYVAGALVVITHKE